MMDIDLLHKIADIQPPVAPDWQSLFINMFLLLILILISLRCFKSIFSNNIPPEIKYTLLTHINKLEQDTLDNHINQRDCAYRLAEILRQAFNLNQLNKPPPFIESDSQQQWHEMLLILNQCRYRGKITTQLDTQYFKLIRLVLITNKDHIIHANI